MDAFVSFNSLVGDDELVCDELFCDDSDDCF